MQLIGSRLSEELQSLPSRTYPRGVKQFSGKKKAHKHKLFGPGAKAGFLLILHNGSPVCPRDKPSLSLGRNLGDEGRQKKFMC